MSRRRSGRVPALFALIVLLMVGYTGFWFYALDQAKKGFAAIVASEHARGHRLDYADAAWGGFPTRISLDLTHIVYEAGSLHLDAGTLTIEAYAWNVTHALARAADHPHAIYRDLNGSRAITVTPSLILAGIYARWSGGLDQIDVEFRDPAVQGVSANGNAFEFQAARLQFDGRSGRGDDGKPVDAIDLAVSADQVALGAGIKPLFGPRITSIRSSVRVAPMPPEAGAWPPDWAAIARRATAVTTKAEIAHLDVDWGGVKAAGAGHLSLDSAHRPDGAITFNVQNVRLLVDALMKAGVLKGASSFLWALPAASIPVPITLTLKDGAATFGPFGAGALGPLE